MILRNFPVVCLLLRTVLSLSNDKYQLVLNETFDTEFYNHTAEVIKNGSQVKCLSKCSRILNCHFVVVDNSKTICYLSYTLLKYSNIKSTNWTVRIFLKKSEYIYSAFKWILKFNI